PEYPLALDDLDNLARARLDDDALVLDHGITVSFVFRDLMQDDSVRQNRAADSRTDCRADRPADHAADDRAAGRAAYCVLGIRRGRHERRRSQSGKDELKF